MTVEKLNFRQINHKENLKEGRFVRRVVLTKFFTHEKSPAFNLTENVNYDLL